MSNAELQQTLSVNTMDFHSSNILGKKEERFVKHSNGVEVEILVSLLDIFLHEAHNDQEVLITV